MAVDVIPLPDDHPICEEIEALEGRFRSLSFSILEELIERKVDVKQIRKHIFFLPYRLKKDVSRQVEDLAPEIRQRKNMDRLFVYLDRTIWNFIDYTLLEHIVRQFGSTQLRGEMEIYVADITHFCKQTTVSQLIKYWPGRKDTPPTYCELKTTINRDPDYCTLEQLNILRKELYKQLEVLPPLSECALLLCNSSNGSIIVKWFIAIDLVPALMSNVRKTESSTFFEDNSIESIQIRDIVVYPEPSQPSSTTSGSEPNLSKGICFTTNTTHAIA